MPLESPTGPGPYLTIVFFGPQNYCGELLWVDLDIQNVVPAYEDIPILCQEVCLESLCGLLKDDIHVVVASNHSAPILNVVLQFHHDRGIEAMEQHVDWSSWRFQNSSPSSCLGDTGHH